MPRERKDGHYINLRIDRGLYERFSRYCDQEERTKTAALERMMRAYLDAYEKQNASAKKKKL
ncbi:MAG: hypothetical protein IJM63_00060 [Solobacterium sp.]|jgi:hypothetical protein|nr:hypothetical protein [Solobacterium sp.]MBQ9822861.1 hypothetical protein [Solobacterium sp.]